MLDKADYSSEWLKLFQEATTQANPDPFSSLLPPSQSWRLPMYQNFPTSSVVPGEVAFRICAIRELFEESGVLLARRKKDVAMVADLLPGSFQPAVKMLPWDTLNRWRVKIHNDSYEFASFCK